MRNRTPAPVAAVVAAATLAWLLAACGGGTAPSASAAPPAAPVVAGASTTVELATCSSTSARARLSPAAKTRYLTLCRDAVRGDAAVAAVAARECRHIVSQTVPAPAQAAMQSGCPRP